jgi:polyisoprenoid-binding protein YceI
MSIPQATYTITPSNDSTLAIEIGKTGLWKRRKHFLFFEKFEGYLAYDPDCPEASCVNLSIDATSLVCRDPWLKPKKQKAVTRYARAEALDADHHPEITFASTRIARKALRGFSVEGLLEIRDVSRAVKLNVILSQVRPNQGREASLQIDGDATFRLSEFGIQPPSSFWGFVGTRDEVLIRALLWATQAK